VQKDGFTERPQLIERVRMGINRRHGQEMGRRWNGDEKRGARIAKIQAPLLG
jgi:hypothetical protein